MDTSKGWLGEEQLRKTFDKTYGIKLKEHMLWHTWELWETHTIESMFGQVYRDRH
jgi:hypothetical protein